MPHCPCADATTVETAPRGAQAALWRINRLKSPLKFVWIWGGTAARARCPEWGAGMRPAGGCCSRSKTLGLRVTQLDPRRGSSITNNSAQTPLLTCAANEQQPPEQLPYLQHNVRYSPGRVSSDEAGGGRPEPSCGTTTNCRRTDFWSLSLPVSTAQ